MSLFIACLLIYQFDMPWWMYGVAAVVWGVSVYFESDFRTYMSRA